MTAPSFDQVDADVDEALKSMVDAEFPGLAFSYSIVPSKPINDGGFGATWNGWRGLLERLRTAHLNPRPEYSAFAVGPVLVDHTLNKALTSARIQLRNRLWLCVNHACDPS